MCKRDIGLKLCSCGQNSIRVIQNLFSEEIKCLEKKETLDVFGWTLDQYLGEEWIGMDGMIYMPENKLTDELTEDFFLKELNENECFDFEYIPSEGDNLIFQLKYIFDRKGRRKKNTRMGFISFIFKGEKWTISSYNCFYDKTERMKEGVVKVNKSPTGS